MNQLFELLLSKSGVILSTNDCSAEAIAYAREKGKTYTDVNGNTFAHFTSEELIKFGGGIKNPKPH